MRMFFKKKNKKLPSKVKYQSSQFRTKLTRARSYERRSGGWASFSRTIKTWRWSARTWLFAASGVGVFCLAVYIVFYPNWFFIQKVQIVGGRTVLGQELQGQVERYLTQRTYFISHRNLLFLPKHDLQNYLLAVNPAVWRIEEIKKQWPHSLLVRIVPRDPAFIVTTNDGTWLISNDGLVVPTVADPPTMLPIVAYGLKRPELGQTYFSRNLLATLTAIKKDFSALTGLPSPSAVVLKPVLLDVRAGSSFNAPLSATQSAGAAFTPPVSLPQISNVMPEEVQVVVPKSNPISTFSVLLQVADNFDEVFRQLQVLLAKQSADRLQNLAYVDMRFSGKAFICLQNTPCAKSVELVPNPAPTVSK